MLINFFYFFLITLSSIGYGSFLHYKTNLKSEEFSNFGVIGLTGLFLLNIFSYSLSFFDKIFSSVNIFIILLGIFFFFTYLNKIRNKCFYICLLFLTLVYIGILIGKPHDDFHYYHFPYIHYLLNSDFIFGVGHLNHGFRTTSSIFYLNAIFYNKYIGYGIFHYGAALYMLFANIYLFEKIKFFSKNNYKNFSIFAICIFIFLNIFFYRIAEHGTDRSAQIISLIFLLEIFILINFKYNLKNRVKILIIFLGLIISLKVFYILFVVFSFIVIRHLFIDQKKDIKEIFQIVFLNPFFLLFIIYISYIITVSFINTGCLLYPVSLTCLDNLPWSLGSDEATIMNNWYELWSKGGATPNMRVENQEEYLTFLNWVPNWINIYFFTKVSDLLLGLIFVALIIIFTFKLRLVFSKYKFKILIFLILILMIEWFYNHPALRYGGYSLIAAIFFLIISSLKEKKSLAKNLFQKKINYLILITLSIFLLRNVDRITNEYEKYSYNPFKDPYYVFNSHDFRVMKKIDILKEDIFCKKNNNNCKDNEFKINFLFNKKLYISRRSND